MTKNKRGGDPVTVSEYIERYFVDYKMISVLSNKNDCRIIRMRNTVLGRDLVLRRYKKAVKAYELLRNVTHRNFPEVYDAVLLEDGQLVLEEYIEGITVADVIATGCYTYKGAAAVVEGVCTALMTLHQNGFVHRDIKPENIMIDKTGAAKLLDLGASRQRSELKNRDTVALGTVGYAPPEQYGISQSDCTADIYAVGVLLNVMLTGEHPSVNLARGKAGRVILKCTSISPENRFQSVEKLIKSL